MNNVLGNNKRSEEKGELNAKVGVIIPHYNDTERLSKCLAALEKQDFPKEQFIVVVVDNGSENLPVISDALTIKSILLVESKPGSYSARNKGVRSVECEIYAFTDSDCIPCDTWLSSAVARLEKDGQVAVCGPIVLFPQNNEFPNFIELIELDFGFPQLTYLKEQKFAPTANLITKASAFDVVGQFNDTLLSGGDEDWGTRLHSKGLKIDYEPKATVLHPARFTIKQYLTKTRRVVHGKWKKYQESNVGNYTFVSTCKYLLPPQKDIRRIFTENRVAPLHTKFLASLFLYLNSLYIFFVFTKARISKSLIMERN